MMMNDQNGNMIGDLNEISDMLDQGILPGPLIKGDFLEWLDQDQGKVEKKKKKKKSKK